MPARRRKDVFDDLKQVVVANSNTGMSYRAIASVTEQDFLLELLQEY